MTDNVTKTKEFREIAKTFKEIKKIYGAIGIYKLLYSIKPNEDDIESNMYYDQYCNETIDYLAKNIITKDEELFLKEMLIG